MICGLAALEVARVHVLGADQKKADSGNEIVIAYVFLMPSRVRVPVFLSI